MQPSEIPHDIAVDEIVEKIKVYQQENHVLPDSLATLGPDVADLEKKYHLQYDPFEALLTTGRYYRFEDSLLYRLSFGIIGKRKEVSLWRGKGFPIEQPFKKVVEALGVGMTKPQVIAAVEANAKIESDSFKVDKSLNRPETGWPSERRLSIDLGWRAGLAEKKTGAEVHTIEYFPIHRGSYDGELYLYYSTDALLVAGQMITLKNNHIETEEFF